MSSLAITSMSPPRARIAFRVGVAGHRPNRLPKDEEALGVLQSMLRCVLEEIENQVVKFAATDEAKRLYSSEPPILRAVSPLAEGADRMFAEAALNLGYHLLCPMPFHRDEFEKDFSLTQSLQPHSQERFRGLLDRARTLGEGALTIFELDGDRRAEEAAYGAAGRVVLNQSDLLIAIWDGQRAAGAGGTVQMLREAVHYHVPVLWLQPSAPLSWQLLTAQDLEHLGEEDLRDPARTPAPTMEDLRAEIAAAVATIVADEFALPRLGALPRSIPITKTHAYKYFRERKPWLNLAFAWKLFRDLIGEGRIRIRGIAVPSFETQIGGDWPLRSSAEESAASTSAAQIGGSRSQSATHVEDWINRRLRGHFAWADRLGDLYGDAYRSANILIYLLSAAAVFLALLPMAAGLEGAAQVISVAVELAILLIIVLLLVVGSVRHWHERWMEYRLLAELIRQHRILIPLGGGQPFPRVPAHLSNYGGLDQTWMYWHMRAIARATGIPNVKVTAQYLRDCLDHMAKVVGSAGGGQLKFHQETGRRAHHIWHRLHVMSTSLFILTILSIAAHFLLGLSDSALPWLHSEFLEANHATIDRWLVLLAAALPALGAALAGIANQGEFARLSKRSTAMADAFTRFAAQINQMKSQADETPLTLSRVIPLAEKISEIMIDEVSDWRVIVVEPPVRA